MTTLVLKIVGQHKLTLDIEATEKFDQAGREVLKLQVIIYFFELEFIETPVL
jgi:hypothetical protein